MVTDQQLWHQRGVANVEETPGLFTYQVHVVRGDATNSCASQRSKVHTCTAKSTYCSMLQQSFIPSQDSELVGEVASLPFRDRVRDCQADLQYIASSCTGTELYFIYNRQLENMGLQPFEPREETVTSVRVLFQVTDDGGDQRGCDSVIQRELRPDRKTLFHRFRCVMHQVHLIVSKQLKRLPGALAGH